ncbi:hypothetical protein ABI_11020 [Asticcacaulis biprosthecium C19]|uniref:Uncharacterized protein n=1 Tax=Asticcacaulis biprosthecium C19 TaxID=715226 RepID=F4QHC7_9CAUL|nr:hypothetical protein ABI_11020 [Asticcacaulis biprosthecium C19]
MTVGQDLLPKWHCLPSPHCLRGPPLSRLAAGDPMAASVSIQ